MSGWFRVGSMKKVMINESYQVNPFIEWFDLTWSTYKRVDLFTICVTRLITCHVKSYLS